MDLTKKEKVDSFIRNFKGTRTELNKALKSTFGVQLTSPGKYKKHTGFKQRVRNLQRAGKSMDEIETILFGTEVENV